MHFSNKLKRKEKERERNKQRKESMNGIIGVYRHLPLFVVNEEIPIN